MHGLQGVTTDKESEYTVNCNENSSQIHSFLYHLVQFLIRGHVVYSAVIRPVHGEL
jgi:hypothetical protein